MNPLGTSAYNFIPEVPKAVGAEDSASEKVLSHKCLSDDELPNAGPPGFLASLGHKVEISCEKIGTGTADLTTGFRYDGTPFEELDSGKHHR
jgi:hypothetical protein